MIENTSLSRAFLELWQPNPENKPSNEGYGRQPNNDSHRLSGEMAFPHIFVEKEREPPYIPLSTNLNLKLNRLMLYFPMDFGELTIDGLIDTGAHSSAIHEAELRKIFLLVPQSIVNEGPAPSFQTIVTNGDLQTPTSTAELKFEVGDIEFYEIFIVMGKLSSPIIGLMLLQRKHTVLDMRQSIINFPFFSMQLKTADHKYSNVMELILNPEDVTIPPNDHKVVIIQSQIYAENTRTGILQPSDLLHEDEDVTFCAAIVTFYEEPMKIHRFTDQPYKLEKALHIANFSVMTPEQMNHVKPLDPVSTWHLLN